MPKHDARATAPNFTVAKERLKPGWTKRWMLDPALMSPGTAMPSRPVPHGRRTTGSSPVRRRPASTDITKDHADLLVRYMFQFTPEELGAFAQQRGRGRIDLKEGHR